jgi:hypothetical protein
MGADRDIVDRQPLPHNELNAVTTSVEKVETADGHQLVRKEIGRHKPGSADHWQASEDPRHWNWWRREADVYASQELRQSLVGTGLEIPTADIEVDPADPGHLTLWIEYVNGTPGTQFGLGDHQALARGLGRWQAAPPPDEPWASRGFIRAYSASKPAPYELVDDDRPWSEAIIRDCWPGSLRTGWKRLLDSRPRLLDVLERLPRARCHLDVWASNATRRPDGTVALFDWSFYGDGARGEDIGNQVPDGVFDLFWPAQEMGELETAVFTAYLDGLRQAGWDGDHREVRLAMTASCVKYAWLLPQMLAEAHDPVARAYWRDVAPNLKYTARGVGLARLVNWCDEAMRLADQLGY